MGPFANWPNSCKVRQLYGGNETQGEEIILASAFSTKVMHIWRGNRLNRKSLTRLVVYRSLTGGAIYSGRVFWWDQGKRYGWGIKTFIPGVCLQAHYLQAQFDTNSDTRNRPLFIGGQLNIIEFSTTG